MTRERRTLCRLLLSTLLPLAWSAGPGASRATAQIRLPQTSLPSLPVQVPVDVEGTARALTRDTPLRALQRVREQAVRQLLRRHRDVLDTDPRGAPVVRREVLAYSPTGVALEAARAAGFAVTRRNRLDGLEVEIVVLQAPADWSTRRALGALRRLDPAGSYDFNHVYQSGGLVTGTLALATPQAGDAAVVPGGGTRSGATQRLGLIDGGVDTQHATLRDGRLRGHGCGGQPWPSAHGTAVASVMVGRAPGFSGAAPGAELLYADVYCGAPTGGAVDAVVEALAWLARERVPVINVSLVGPPNLLLGNVVRLVVARGTLVVAAVGNDGPAAPPLYPASYPDVIAVTAVDARRRVLLEAGRGTHVDFAAPGAELPAAAAGTPDGFAAVRGTSFAAPIVAGLLAAEFDAPGRELAIKRVALLNGTAIDLGSRGHDSTYGAGLVGEAVRTGNLQARITSNARISASSMD